MVRRRDPAAGVCARGRPSHLEDGRTPTLNALLLCTGDPSADPRPRRVRQLLTELGATVTVASEMPPRRSLSRLRTVAGMLSPAREAVIGRRFGYDQYRATLGGERFELVIVEDIYLLPLAFEYSDRVVMDAREYYPRVHESSIAFRMLQRPELVWLCREWLPRCEQVLTVSDGLAHEFEREFGVATTVVRSTPDAQDWPVNRTAPDRIRLVHHGVANPDRRLHNLLEIVRRLDGRFSLDLYLTGNEAEIGRLKARLPQHARILPPVPFADIGKTLNAYDIGLFYVEPTTFNLKHCLPNKLFEFIQARLAVAIGPSPDMAAVVREYGCGVVAPAFSVEAMAKVLNGLSAEDVDAMKRRSDEAARVLNWQVESQKLVGVLNRDAKSVAPTGDHTGV